MDVDGKPVADCRVGSRGQGQPDNRTAKTDDQGKFTIEKICPGDIEVWAKLDGLLYGKIETQAGKKNIKIVVSAIN